MQREIAPASSRSVEASIKDKPSEKDLRFLNFGPSSNHCSVTGAGLKAREINLFHNEVLGSELFQLFTFSGFSFSALINL